MPLPHRTGLAVFLFAISACQRPVDPVSEAAALLNADKAWAAAAGAGVSVDSILSFWTDDARVISPGERIFAGKDAIRAMVTQSFAIPGFRISWQPEHAVVSAAGDLGYSVGTNRIVVPDSSGKPMTIDGRYVTVWRKGSDGRWRCVEDIYNAGPPSGAAPGQ